MIETLLTAALRATILAAITGLSLSVFRVRDAALRHMCWTLVLGAMIAMPLLTGVLPSIDLPLLPSAVPRLQDPVAIVTTTSVGLAGVPEPETFPVGGMLALIYGAVTLALISRWELGYYLGLRLVRSSRPLDIPSVERTDRCRESEHVSVPLTFGWIRPAILLPVTFREWTLRRLETVIAHETAHIDRRDFATDMLAALVRAVFWFHPLAWWLEWRISTLAEQAADDIAAAGDPHEYAEALLDMAGRVESGRVHGLAMVGRGRTLKARIHRLLDPSYTHAEVPMRYRTIASVFLIALTTVCGTTVISEASRPLEQESPIVEAEGRTGAVPQAEEAPPEPGEPAAVQESPIAWPRAFFFELWERNIAGERFTVASPSQEELETFEQLTTDEERIAFIEEFWLRRPQEGGEADDASPQLENRLQQEPSPDSPDQPQSPGEADEEPLRLGGDVTAPRIVERVEPEFPQSARDAEIRQALVVLDTIVRRDGTADVISVTRSSAPGDVGRDFADRASSAIRQWRFAPGTRNGEPVDVRLNIEVNFTLQGGEEGVLRPEEGVTRPTVRARVEPVYPSEARAERRQGTVVLDTIIRQDGTPEVVSVLESLGSDLDQAAIEAVSRWRFNPGRRNGEPVDVRLNIEVNFTLR